MNIITKSNCVKSSSQKLILIANFIINKMAHEALEYLLFIYKKSSYLIRKTLNSAISNAEHNYGLSIDSLKILNVYINKGPSFKRIMPRAKGKMDCITKRTSHITIILCNKEEQNGTKNKS